jgi:SAM-dependent methyltransferase
MNPLPKITLTPNKTTNPFIFLKLVFESQRAIGTIAQTNPLGVRIARFGQQIGLRMLLRRKRPSVSYILSPVSSTRYFELPFAYQHLPVYLDKCLDVSSPSLFSFYVANQHRSASIQMINPDSSDLALSQTIASTLKINNLLLNNTDLFEFINQEQGFDAIWSLSVVEHIDGEYDDSIAVNIMYRALNRGGRLILTLPVDREFWIEYREEDSYNLGRVNNPNGFFFQRHYDEESIWKRIINSVGVAPTILAWYGEKERGSFQAYQERWKKEGYLCTIQDPREFAENYTYYKTWQEMPGQGVCGIVFEK